MATQDDLENTLLGFGKVLTLISTSSSSVDDLILDASLSETYLDELEITTHKVEKGADITDHAEVKPQKFTMEGLISNTPVSSTTALQRIKNVPAAFNAAVQKGGAVLGAGSFSAGVALLLGQRDYAREAYNTLQAMQSQKLLLGITTLTRHYDNMLMLSLSVPKTSKTGDGLTFTASFQAIQRVASATTTITIPQKVAEVDKGTRTTTTTEAETPNRSYLKGFTNSMGWTTPRGR